MYVVTCAHVLQHCLCVWADLKVLASRHNTSSLSLAPNTSVASISPRGTCTRQHETEHITEREQGTYKRERERIQSVECVTWFSWCTIYADISTPCAPLIVHCISNIYPAYYKDPTEMRISPLIKTLCIHGPSCIEKWEKTTPERRTPPLIRTLLDVVCGIEGFHCITCIYTSPCRKVNDTLKFLTGVKLGYFHGSEAHTCTHVLSITN